VFEHCYGEFTAEVHLLCKIMFDQIGVTQQYRLEVA